MTSGKRMAMRTDFERCVIRLKCAPLSETCYAIQIYRRRDLDPFGFVVCDKYCA